MENEFQHEIFDNEILTDSVDGLTKYLINDKEIILCVNIRSINANYNKLLVFINNLIVKPNIIICTESWNLEHQELFNIPNYKMYYNNSRINKSDGVVVYVSDNIIETTEILQFNKLKIINSKISLVNNKSIVLSAIYRSHDIPKTEFLLNIKELIKHNNKLKNNILVGDFNFDILDKDILDQEFLQELLMNGYYPGHKNITRPSDINNNGSCIDNFFIKLENMNYKNYLLQIPFNDHFPIIMSLKNIKKSSNKNSIKKINYHKLDNIAHTINWLDNTLIPDPNQALKNLTEKIKTCQNKAEDRNYNNKNKNMKPRKNWITKAIIVSCRNKEKLYNIWKKDPNNQIKKENYKNYVKVLNRVINTAKEQFDKNLISRNANKPKNLWKIINSKIGKNLKKDNKINYIIDNNNKKINNSKEIADYMNKFFSNIGKQLSDKIKPPQNERIKLPQMNEKTIFLQPTSYNEIQEIILSMENKNGGIDGINSLTLKTLVKHISHPLAHIFNECLEKGIWPEDLKTAEIIPLYKSKEKILPTNYRPISLISNIAKIFEKLLHKRIANFLNDCNLFSNKQFGFRKGKGTKDALYEITNIIYNQLDTSKPIAITFLDLAQAFDTVDHQILLDKLYSYGIRGNAHTLIKSYLNKRKQRVRVNNNNSNFETVGMGVPQGTILGPLLFIIYINDMLTSMPENTILSYADDTAIITIGNNWQEVENKMNNNLQIIANWLALNKLSLNTDKTVYMEFGNNCNSTPKNLNINIQGNSIKRVEETRYLGVNFDSNMRWNVHIDNIYNKTKYLTFTFYKLSRIMSIENMRMLYYALFHSTAVYGIIAWGGAYTGRTRCLQNLQNRLLKLVNKNNFIQDNPLNIEQTFTYEALVYHYNILQTKYIDSNKITRNKSLQIPRRFRNISIKNSYIRALTIFNRLPNELKTISNKNRLKTKIKTWIRENL